MNLVLLLFYLYGLCTNEVNNTTMLQKKNINPFKL